MGKADEILKKYEDLNEYHFYEIDRKWIIEAMEEYKNIPLDKPVKPEIAKEIEKYLFRNTETREQQDGESLDQIYEDKEIDCRIWANDIISIFKQFSV